MEAVKPLQVNPIKLSQPIGATLAFLGIKDCIPLMHGAQGCASFTKVFLTRHFHEPIAIQNTAVSDITAVLDGGDGVILSAIETILKKEEPALIGLHSTGLTETKGDDLQGIATLCKHPLVYVNTPDYEGGLESGWALCVKALIEQISLKSEDIINNKITLLPNVNLQAIEVEKIKEFLTLLGFEVFALPDLSSSLDGSLKKQQGKLSQGAISVEEIRHLANSEFVLSIGHSMLDAATALLEKNETMIHLHLTHLNGLQASDALVQKLLRYKALNIPKSIQTWRMRLQDAMLDSHFRLGKTRFIVTGEPDFLVGLSAILEEVGAQIFIILATSYNPLLESIKCEKLVVGDLEDIEPFMSECDVLVGNFHCHDLAKKHGKVHLCRGYPNWEELGSQLKNTVLYEGSTYELFEMHNYH